jgi:hypothetical protein
MLYLGLRSSREGPEGTREANQEKPQKGKGKRPRARSRQKRRSSDGRPRTQQAVNDLLTLSIQFWPRRLSAVGRAASRTPCLVPTPRHPEFEDLVRGQGEVDRYKEKEKYMILLHPLHEPNQPIHTSDFGHWHITLLNAS